MFRVGRFIFFGRVNAPRACSRHRCCYTTVAQGFSSRMITNRTIHYIPTNNNYAALSTYRTSGIDKLCLLYARNLSSSAICFNSNKDKTIDEGKTGTTDNKDNENINNKEIMENINDKENMENINNKENEWTKEKVTKNDSVKDKSETKGFFAKVKFVGIVFGNGCKNLAMDVRYAFQIRRKLGLYSEQNYSKLTRDEVRHLHQTRADMKKTFPVMALFFVPIVGYFAPILAYRYPQKLLPQQFLDLAQQKAFLLEEYEKRSQYYLPLIKEVAVTCKEIQSKELYKLCMHVIKGNHPTNAELLQFKEVFSSCQDFSLQNVPRYHLVKLCKCWLIPTGWFLPRSYMMRALRKRIARLHLDDTLILREGVHIMTAKAITKAAHVRGLDESPLNELSVFLWLDEWVQMSSKVSDSDVSFLAHCAAFKAANFEKITSASGYHEED